MNSPKAERVSDACTDKAGPLQYDIEVKPPCSVPVSSGQVASRQGMASLAGPMAFLETLEAGSWQS